MRRARKLARNAELVTDVGRRLIELAGVEPGMELLDVACGTGNAAIPAAQSGARAIGLDPSADMLAVARERAADYMIEVDWVEGDPRELPFADASFDRLVSVFGPDDERVAGEMRRVCRPGGAVAVASWVPVTGAAIVERGTLDWDGEAREYVLAVAPT
jgi:ubiquinone/menaquinone biosynthesis C-methylase UbiE